MHVCFVIGADATTDAAMGPLRADAAMGACSVGKAGVTMHVYSVIGADAATDTFFSFRSLCCSSFSKRQPALLLTDFG